MTTQRPFTISTTPRQPDNSSSLKSMKFARGGNQDSNVLRRERARGFEGLVCLSAEIAAGGSTQSSSSSIGERKSVTVTMFPIVSESGSTNDDTLVRVDRGAGGCDGSDVNASPSSSTSASAPLGSVSASSSSSSLMLMKFCWREFRGMRPGTRDIPSRHARALERSALRLRDERTEVVCDEKDMNECC
jgi:hypothetical protein